MAKPCIVKYKGKEYSVEQFSAMLHDGLLNNLIESGAIDQNKLKGDLKLLQDKGISFRYTLQEDGVSVVLEGTEAINKGANAQTIRTGTRKSNNLKYIDNYSFDDVLNETYNTNSGAVSLAIKLGEGIFNYKKKNKTTGVVSKKSFVIPFLNIEAANKLKKLRKEYKKLNPPESKEEKARKAEDKRLLTQEQLKQKQAENRAKKAEERKLLSKEEKKAIADKNAKDKKRSAKIKEELNQITKQILVDFHKMMVLNLLAIYDTLDQKFVQLSKDWYLGANRFANAYANKYKLTVEQAAAIIAVLSPQNDWFNNLSVAERVMDIMANYSNTKMTSDIIEKAIKNQTTGEEEKNFVDVLRVAFKKFGEVSIEDLRKMGATEEVQAIYLRAFDHAFHSNKVAMTDPTGKFIGFDKTPVRWNSTSEITKAITVYRDSSMVTINDQLGGGSKVRNFYNNIVDPNSPTPYVTSDTHAAAAAMAIPMSANDAGTGFKLFDSGLNPVYAMVKQAYISAADIVGLFPREFQSITWEGTRLGINDKNRTEEKKNETFNEVSKLRENPKTNAYENARAIIAINPSGDPIWGESRGIKTQKSTFKDSESIRSDSDKRISQVSNYGQESGRLRGDSTRVGGETTRGQADTGEVSFRFEKSGTATVKNAPKGTYLNIGLLKGETEELISIDDVLSNLPSDVKVIKQRQVTGTEPTLALQINRKMSDQEMEDFRNATAQMAIPQLSDGKGVIHGTQEWGEFNPEFFVLPNNKPLSSIKGVEITSVEPNEEGPSFRNEELIKPSGFSYEETIKMAGSSLEEIQEWKKKNKVDQKQKRNPVVQKAAEQYKKGNINQYQMMQAVRENQQIKPFVMVPKIPSFKEIIGSLKTNMPQNGIIGLTKNIPDGTLVGTRLDIDAYEDYDIWTTSIHDGTGYSTNGKIIGYGPTAVLKNVIFKTSATAALNIAIGKEKQTVARMFGEWVNEDPQSVRERAEKAMNDPAWTQIGMNPFRHSWFYDKANGNPVISTDEIIQVGALVLGKNVVMGSITDQQFKTKNEKGEEIFFRKDDKVKGTYFEPAMTTDSKGNYVFFHFSTAPLKSLMKGIDSRRYYSTRTSREEKGLQYGVASYYTKPTDSENVVGGDKYYVTVSPDKVYPMDLDPNGYRAAAEKKFKKNTPFRESRISKEIANAAARDGYQMAVGEWSFDRAGLTQSETPEFRGDALVPLKPTELTGKEKFKTGKERGIKTEHPDKARLAFNQQVEDLASDIDSYKSSKGKFDDAYEIASTVMVYGGIVEDYGTKDERVRPLTREEFDKMTKGLSPKLKQRAEKLRSQMEDMGVSFRVDENYKNNIEKQLGKFDEQIKNKKFPSALEVAKYILPKEIFDRYRNLYEMAARNNIQVTIDLERLPYNSVATYSYGFINLSKFKSSYNINNYEEFAEVFNHEIIHGLLSKGIDGFTKKFDFHNNLQNIMQAVIDNSDSASENVKAIISYIVEAGEEFEVKDYYNATKEESESGNYRSVNDLEELITYAFTNTEFAEFLDSIPASKDIDVKGKSIFQQLKNIIRDYIKKLVKGPTALDEINSVLENYFDTSIQEEVIARANSEDNRGLKFNADEISFRAGNTRRIVTELRLQAILKGSNFKDLRNAINVSPTSFYTPQKYAQLKPQIASMSNAELIAAIDVESSLENIINVSDGPIVGLAFIEYINRLKNIVEDPNSTQTDIDDANQLIQDTYAKIAPFTTKVAQILRQLGEIKSTIKKDEVQFYLDMIEALIEANGNMINDEHRQALKDIIQLLLDSKNNHTSLFNDLANKGSNVTDQDIFDLNMAEVELQNANAALHMLVAFLSPPSTARFWAGVLKGNLMSMRSATIGLLSNIINIGLFRVRNLVHAGISVPFAILHYAGVNVFGLEKYQLFNTSMAWSNVKYALFLDIIQDALVGIAKAIATLSKMMIGKESFRGFLDKSPTANRVFNIIKYGSSGLEGGSPVEIDHSNHIMLSIKNAFTGKGQKTRLNIRGIKMDVANSYKRTNFSKWFKANYPGSDYNALSAKDKKIIQNEYFNDPKAMVPTLGERAGGLGKAFMAWNSEAIFRLVALSDYLPKTYASNVEMTRLAQTLGLDEKQTILFMKDPAKYIEIVQNILSPEVLKFWTDTVAEVTVTKDTGIGVASVALVEGLKTYFPQKLLQKYPELKNNEWFNVAVSTYSLFIDTIFPFVKIPMNFISLVSDYLIPSKPFAKALYFAGLALHNKGTDQADAYALSFVKNISTAVVAMGLRSLAVGLVAIPGMVVIAPGKDDDDEKRKMKSKFSRMSVNIDALKRYFSGEDPSYKQGDRYQGLAAYGVLGMNIYNYATINEKANQEYYDKLKNAPKNVNPKELNLGSPFDIKGAGWFELELKSFESSQNFIDQSWFVGLNSTLQGLTGGDQGADRFVNSYINTLLSFWWGFSSHAQQISDIYREATGKPVFDVTLPTNLQDINKEGYPGTFGDRVWNNIFKKNELIHKALIDIPENSEYIKFDMYGEPMTPVPGNAKNNLEIMLSVSGPMRTARTNLTKEERLYMAVYDNKNKINIPGKTLSLIEPTLKKSEKITVFMTDTNGKKVAETIDVIIKPSDYNKINKMAGDALRDLHTVLLSEQGLLDYEVRGKVISPEDIMSKNWGNTREVANVRNAIALTFSEGNKLLNKFLKPWEMFGENIGEYIDKDIIATIQGVKSLVASKLSEYEVLNPETGQMEMLTNYLVGHPELESKLYNLALESIKLYLKLADESIKNNEEWNKVTDNPEMTIEQEKARKEGNF
jgi:hypothetical protein